MTTSDSGEIGVSELQGYASGLLPLLAQLTANSLTEITQCCLKEGAVSGIFAKGSFPADRLSRRRELYFSIVNAAGVAIQKLTKRTKMRF